MTDSRLQQLRRAWEASGSVEDEAAYLRERVRVGELSQERLELAALCGHEPARASLEDPPKDQPPVAWAETLGKLLFSVDVGRAASIAHDLALPYLPQWEQAYPEVREPRLALEAVSSWVEAPVEVLRTTAVAAGLRAELAVSEATLRIPTLTPAIAAGFGCAYVALSLGRQHEFPEIHPFRGFRLACCEAFSVWLEVDPHGFWSRDVLKGAGALLLSDTLGSVSGPSG